MITRSLETTSILVVIERICRYQFKSIYLRNHQPIALLPLIFWNVHEVSNVLKKIEAHRSSISEVIDSERGAYLNQSQGFFRKILWQ